MTLNDPAVVALDYATETRLLDRRAIYESSKGPSPLDVLWRRIGEVMPEHVLEVGPGPGELSERIVKELDADVAAIDVSPRMVELTRAHGIDTRVGDVQDLPFEDGVFDLVAAGWVLFHPADLARALSEIARVLRPGGRLVAATNSEQHLAELWTLVGVERQSFSFSLENGETALRRYFTNVTVERVEGWVTFPDTAVARDYVAASIILGHLAERVPDLSFPLRARRLNGIFVGEKAL